VASIIASGNRSVKHNRRVICGLTLVERDGIFTALMGANSLQVDQIDWASWRPTEYANLCFVIRDGQILLIRKKRGLGSGKINGPGGRIEKGETALEAAIRETQEEIGVTPTGLEEIGDLHFHFLNGYKLHVAVFRADDCTGGLCETSEATPYWIAIDAIPYHEMWQDDPHWLPLVLARTRFRGFFIFDEEQLLSHRVERIT
jgi:8-oxo-dGTP diphosphatase